jgi:hypothetical protein
VKRFCGGVAEGEGRGCFVSRCSESGGYVISGVLYKLLYLFVYLFSAVVLGRKFILYVYDLPMEQNLAVWGMVPHVGLSRVFERLFLRFASAILVFNSGLSL